MKRWLLVLSVAFSLGTAHTQHVYLGGGASLLTDGTYSSPLLGLQASICISAIGPLEVRGVFETVLLGSSLSADLLYRLHLQPLELYLGAGPEILFAPVAYPTVAPTQVTPLGDPNLALHGVVGLEYRAGRFGVFGEVQPILTLDYLRFGYAKVRSGVNVYF